MTLYTKLVDFWMYVDDLDKQYVNKNRLYQDKDIESIATKLESLLPEIKADATCSPYYTGIKKQLDDLYKPNVINDQQMLFICVNIIKDKIHHMHMYMKHPDIYRNNSEEQAISKLREYSVNTFPRFKTKKKKSSYYKVQDMREWWIHGLIKTHIGKEFADLFFLYIHDRNESLLNYCHDAARTWHDCDHMYDAVKNGHISKDKYIDWWRALGKIIGHTFLGHVEHIDKSATDFELIDKELVAVVKSIKAGNK